MREKTTGSSRLTGRGLSESEKSQSGELILIMALGKNCTKDVECHTP